jgi:hypothetical protein
MQEKQCLQMHPEYNGIHIAHRLSEGVLFAVVVLDLVRSILSFFQQSFL